MSGGIARAKEQGKAVTLFAVTMRERPYGKFGSRIVGLIKSAGRQREEEKVEIPGSA